MLGLGYSVDERFRERMNLEKDMDPQLFFKDWTRACQHRNYVPLGGRSSSVTGAEFKTAVMDLLETYATIVISSHGGGAVDFLRTLFGDVSVERAFPSVIEKGLPSCGITHVTYEQGAWSLVSIGNTEHLEEQYKTAHKL